MTNHHGKHYQSWPFYCYPDLDTSQKMGVQAKLISGIHDSIHQQDAAVAVVQGAALFTMMIYPPVNIEMWKTRHE